ncbi:uncharacterized protein LOC131869190 [Cryptomeria japonica]|uniref:uncharacterized protein LOC131869190 n=1 Tax=Cryptomeria japonica TaxID=3369 RepID=UPI0027DA358E|nr:uncharacterized protein LOC131869190 [Cryptomeria japonica]
MDIILKLKCSKRQMTVTGEIKAARLKGIVNSPHDLVINDKESTEKTDVATKPSTKNVGIDNIGVGEQQQTEESNDPPDTGKAETTDVHIVASTESPTTAKTKKPTESPTVDSTEVNKEKPIVDTIGKASETLVNNTEKQSEKPTDESTVKQTETKGEKQLESQTTGEPCFSDSQVLETIKSLLPDQSNQH